jgi:hypothetical protein
MSSQLPLLSDAQRCAVSFLRASVAEKRECARAERRAAWWLIFIPGRLLGFGHTNFARRAMKVPHLRSAWLCVELVAEDHLPRAAWAVWGSRNFHHHVARHSSRDMLRAARPFRWNQIKCPAHCFLRFLCAQHEGCRIVRRQLKARLMVSGLNAAPNFISSCIFPFAFLPRPLVTKGQNKAHLYAHCACRAARAARTLSGEVPIGALKGFHVLKGSDMPRLPEGHSPG